MVSPADDDSRSGRRGGDLLFLSAALVGIGLLFLLTKDQAPVTGVLTSDLAGGIGILLIVVGVVVGVGIAFDGVEPPGRQRGRRATRGAEARGRRRGPARRRSRRVTHTPPPVGAAPKAEPDAPRRVGPGGLGGLGLRAVGYLALSVSDRDRSVQWYADVLGFEEVFRQESDDRRVSVMRFGPGSYSVGLVERTPGCGEPFNPARPGLDHVAFAVGSREDLVDWALRLGAAGVAHSEVVDIPSGAMLQLADPDCIGLALFWDRATSPGVAPPG